MGKKKRRSNRSKKCRVRSMPGGCDTHHLCFTRRNWVGRYAKLIRGHPYFKVVIPRQTLHRYIHMSMDAIIPPSEIAAKAAYEQVKLLEQTGALKGTDPLEKRLRVLIALFDCIAQPTADGFREQLRIVRNFYKPT